VRKLASEAFARAKTYVWGERLAVSRARIQTRRRADAARLSAPWVRHSKVKRFKSAEQIQLGFLYPAVDMSSRFEADWAALSTLLGSGSSSRLFREIREARGLAYNVSVSLNSFSDSGLVVGHLVTDREKLFEAAQVAGEIFRELPRSLSNDDLEFVRSLLEGSLYMNYESVNNRMETLGRQAMLMKRVLPLKEALAELKALKLSTLKSRAQELVRTPCFFALGPVGAKDLPRIVAAWEGK
jgi:predicted Zn-dependent peptidase